MVEVIRFDGVSKTFMLRPKLTIKDLALGMTGHRSQREIVRAVSDLSFSVSAGQAVALVGHNGSGKSTSLKMLAGVLRPSSGVIRARGRVVPLLEVGAGFHQDLTGRQNIFLNGTVLGISRKELRGRFDEIVDFAGVEDFLDTPVKFYSSGMTIRLGFAIAVSVDPDILLVDELLAVGDSDFQEKSLARMRSFRDSGATIILVTHDIPTAKSFCSRIIQLDHGRLINDSQASDFNYARSQLPRRRSNSQGNSESVNLT